MNEIYIIPNFYYGIYLVLKFDNKIAVFSFIKNRDHINTIKNLFKRFFWLVQMKEIKIICNLGSRSGINIIISFLLGVKAFVKSKYHRNLKITKIYISASEQIVFPISFNKYQFIQKNIEMYLSTKQLKTQEYQNVVFITNPLKIFNYI